MEPAAIDSGFRRNDGYMMGNDGYMMGNDGYMMGNDGNVVGNDGYMMGNDGHSNENGRVVKWEWPGGQMGMAGWSNGNEGVKDGLRRLD